MVFQNDGIDVLQLPKVESVELKGIDRKELMISMGWNVGIFLILLFGLISVTTFSPLQEYIWGSIMLYIGWLVLASLTSLSIWKGFSHKKYALREHDILYQKGWLWQKTIVIPFNRIQHASISQGPFERNFKLSSLHVYTAGGSSSDLSIPGLHIDEAQRIKDFILKQSGRSQDSNDSP